MAAPIPVSAIIAENCLQARKNEEQTLPINLYTDQGSVCSSQAFTYYIIIEFTRRSTDAHGILR